MALPPINTAAPNFAPGTRSATPKAQAAQRAFFQAALGGAAPAAPSAAPNRPAAAAQAAAKTSPTVSLPQDPPTRLLRPGSLVDIKV